MLKFVSGFNDLPEDEQKITYRIRAYMKQEDVYDKNETIRFSLENMEKFFADIRHNIHVLKYGNLFWYEYSRRQKKIITLHLPQDMEVLCQKMIKLNAEDDNDEIVFPNIDLYTFAYGDSLDDKDLIIASYHTQLKTDCMLKKHNRLELSFHGVWRHEDRKPLLNKKDIIDIVRLIYRHYPVTLVEIDDDIFNIRFPTSPDYYEGSYAVFPHRGTCAWMIGLPHKIGQSDIPDTAEAIDIDGKNTLVVSNRDEWFTSFNAEHVQKANFLEIALWEKGLLPVF
ncbi:hypothetical protein CYJ99_09870 [Neisseria perflava]|jgi:hypothetical protein|uniref:Imm52 family immunity protein n=1 Tax=Neisseria perflava TaxID=33053 RepID=A0A9X7F6J1_NEIPE|nr:MULTISPECIES: Imm52 family immunity protein [Neisseria]PLA49279.1 hypothetical protein CYJ99_09870 [Neisseria perflava]WOS98765.1 Imm52 family immunity protein [Neisseria perflava]GMQ51942.1 hypothetical protein LST1_22330 [Neisseria elongata]